MHARVIFGVISAKDQITTGKIVGNCMVDLPTKAQSHKGPLEEIPVPTSPLPRPRNLKTMTILVAST